VIELVQTDVVELDELYWFIGRKERTKTRENVYVMTMVSREPRQLVGVVAATDKSSKHIQAMVDAAPEADKYCTDGYTGYLDVVYQGKHIRNVRDKSDTFTVEGVNADLRHYIPILARSSRCFPRKLETLQAVLAVFAEAYYCFGVAKLKWRASHDKSEVPFSVIHFL
jgi:IS1 family transposase